MARIKRKQWLADFQKTRARAVRMHANGHTMEAIASAFNVTRQRVGQWLKFEKARAK